MNKEKENKRDLSRLKVFFNFVILILSATLFYGGIKVIENNRVNTLDGCMITILAILGIYSTTLLLVYFGFQVLLPKTEKELAIDKAKERIEAEYSLKKAQDRLKKIK